MRHLPRIPAALVALLSAVLLGGCSKDKGTDPGGSTGGTTFDIPLPSGRSAVFTFDHVATHPYHCGIHPAMTGTVDISASSSVDSVVVTVNATAGGFNPSAVTIKVGGYVRWVNVGSFNHSVVSD
jgi:plastocyanin